VASSTHAANSRESLERLWKCRFSHPIPLD
jgi:hypothetical protein